MSAQAGWYDDGSGRHRWWDGQRWTDNYADQQRDHSGVANHFSNVSSALVSNVTARHDPSLEPGTLWSAIGKPLTGIGVGRYRLTEEYLFFEKGTLSTKSQQIRVHEIFDVDATQSMTQKGRGVGTITLRAQRPSGNERVMIEDIPNFREGVAIINRVSDDARQRVIRRRNTQHFNYTGNPAGMPHQSAVAASAGAAAAAGAPGGGLNEELARLVELRQRGVLDDEEFTAAKRKLLGL